jgi:hypothetical protein
MANIAPRLPDLAERINAEHEQAEAGLRAGLLHARNAGELLIQAKAQVPHGGWLPWLAENVCFSERTAQAYMRVARRWEELQSNPQRVADLPFRRAVEALAEPAAPVDVDANLKESVSSLREAAETLKAAGGGPRSVGALAKIKRLAEECIDHAHVIKIDNLTLLGDVLSEPEEVALPDLNPGKRYSIVGRSRYGATLVQVDPHPDHPGYWAMVCYHLFPGDDSTGGFMEYIGRGTRLDVPEGRAVLSAFLGGCEFRAEGEWHEEPASRWTPHAVAEYRKARQAELR